MQKKIYLILFLLLFVGCNSSQVNRNPAQEPKENLETRDGVVVKVPGLKIQLGIPDCKNLNERKNLEECIPDNEAKLFNEITKISFNF